MTRRFLQLLCLGAMTAFGVIGIHQAARAEAAGADDEIPTFRFNPDWPQQLPNNWTTGVIGAAYVAKDDHLWIIQRPNSVTASTELYQMDGMGDCCALAPPVIEFDTAGRVVQAWGTIYMTDTATRTEKLVGTQVSGPYPDGIWPSSEHMIYVDYKGNVWLSSQSPPSQVDKFTHDGKFLMRLGTQEAKSSSDTANLAGPTGIYVDPATNEAYISDGYRNRRILVVDADTGAFKRMWGAFGKPPRDPQQHDAYGTDRIADQFSVTHCIKPGNDGLLYVCDRANDRFQVFKKDGTFVREVYVGVVPRDKISVGTVWDIGFSPDKEQRFMYIADGQNKKVWILRHSDYKVLGSFGHGGRQGGEFETIHVLAVDSKGNVYTGETLSGNRLQRFDFTGLKHISAP